MEQALAGSVVADASPESRALRLDSNDLAASELEAMLPSGLAAYFTAPVVSSSVPVDVRPPDDTQTVITRLYAVTGACEQLEVVTGSCPTASGQVMVSTADVETNGWTVGSEVDFTEHLERSLFPELGEGTVTVVGVYGRRRRGTTGSAPPSPDEPAR